MELNSYKDTWNNRVDSLKSGAIAVDGSTDEQTLLSNGQWTADQMKAALQLTGDEVVLELGCGVGRIGKLLAPHCQHWIGVDISENMLKVARVRLNDTDNVSFHALPRNDLSMIEDHSVDKAYSVAVFCHLDKEDLFNYLRELNRVVKPGGVIYVETWNLTSPVGWKRWMAEADNWAISDHSARKDVARNQFCSPDEFRCYVEKAGFEPLSEHNDSVWNQIVASKDMDDTNQAKWRAVLTDHEAQFVYSPLFTDLFSRGIDVTGGQTHPRDMIAHLDTLGDAQEAILFRRFILGMWQDNEAIWGPIDA